MAAERGPNGRFLKGHTPIPGAHRPPGALNLVTRSLREKILDGFGKDDDGITSFVRDLKRDYPPAAAGLLARMLPPADEKPEGAGGTVIINIQPIARGSFFVGNPPQLVDETATRQIAGTDDAVLMLKHLSTEEANAAPVEILEPEPVIEEQLVDKRDDGGVFVVRSSRLKARRSP
jgi:hypothetical protein